MAPVRRYPVDPANSCGCCGGGAPSTCPCTGAGWDDLVDGTTCTCNGLYQEYEVTFDLEYEEYANSDCTGALVSSCGPTNFEIRVTAKKDSPCDWDPVEALPVLCPGVFGVGADLVLDTVTGEWSFSVLVGRFTPAISGNTAIATRNNALPHGAYSSEGWNCAGDNFRVRITNVQVEPILCDLDCPCVGDAWDDLVNGTTCPCNGLVREYDVTFTVEARDAGTQAAVGSETFTFRLPALSSTECVWQKSDDSFVHKVADVTCGGGGSGSLYTNPSWKIRLLNNPARWEFDSTLASTCGADAGGSDAVKSTGNTPVGNYDDGPWVLVGNGEHEMRHVNVSVEEVSCP